MCLDALGFSSFLEETNSPREKCSHITGSHFWASLFCSFCLLIFHCVVKVLISVSRYIFVCCIDLLDVLNCKISPNYPFCQWELKSETFLSLKYILISVGHSLTNASLLYIYTISHFFTIPNSPNNNINNNYKYISD